MKRTAKRFNCSTAKASFCRSPPVVAYGKQQLQRPRLRQAHTLFSSGMGISTQPLHAHTRICKQRFLVSYLTFLPATAQ
jgi:hypothetical protein